MNTKIDELISKLTVRLTTLGGETIGTGVICYKPNLQDKLYVITSAHCLFEDGEDYKEIYQQIQVDFYNSNLDTYISITVFPDEELLFKDSDNDIAILLFDKYEIEKLINNIPEISIIKEKFSNDKFVFKGFPNATLGKELDTIYATWKQNMTSVSKFQLRLEEDYNSWATEGFSGSGAFLLLNNEVHLLGIFTRFRPEDRGRVIYCQFVKSVNHLLEKNYLPILEFDYLGDFGLTHKFFESHINKSIENLGERYDRKLNCNLPIARRFNDLAKDDLFYMRLSKVIDKWLTEKWYDRTDSSNQIIHIENELKDLKDKVKHWLSNLQESKKKIDYKWLTEKIIELNSIINQELSRLYTEQTTKKDKEKKDSNISWEKEISRLRKISSNNDDFLYDLESKIDIELANNPILLIEGEAGSGKSHLLGDIAENRIKKNQPSLLLLGQHFNNSLTIEKNILTLLDLNVPFEDLLVSLNEIGKQIKSRVIILIDALNEITDQSLWQNQLIGFISTVKKHPYLALTLTIRDTYFRTVIPEKLKEKNAVSILRHNGFNGNEYQALKMFCEFYKLELPKFPIMNPEFGRPLFLKLICKGLQNAEEKSFPSGFQGVYKVFENYLQSINTKLSKQQEYELYSNIVIKAVKVFAKKCFKEGTRHLLVQACLNELALHFPNNKHLLLHLIQEGVLTKNMRLNYSSNENEEFIYFTYEKFGDFYIANELLNIYSNSLEVHEAFLEKNELGKLLDDYSQRGILEAFAILLPERFKLELFEVFDWVFNKTISLKNTQKNFEILNKIEDVNEILLSTLKWRNPSDIDNTKLTLWIRSDKFKVSQDTWFYKLLELSSISQHPFNSDRLFENINRFSMAERDSFWQSYMLQYSGKDDNGNAMPIQRLIDWSWTPEISFQTDFETARLVGQTLTWILSTTNTILRDQVTKAMVNLLEQQPDALIKIMSKFKNIDDPYIAERLYAITYGCILRTEKLVSVKKLASFIYDTTFKGENPPKNILLRDYARNTIEFAIYKKVDLNMNVELIRPPYKSKMPKYPSEEQIKKYDLDRNSEAFQDLRYGRLHNYVSFSTLEWDFGRKIIDPVLRNFHSISFTEEIIYKSYIKNLETPKNKIIREYVSIINTLEGWKKNKYIIQNKENGEGLYDDTIQVIQKYIDKCKLQIDNVFNAQEKSYINLEIIPYLINKGKKINYFDSPKPEPVKRWIVKRVFDLGYNVEIHGEYDNYCTKFSDHSYRSHIERIGKKYQWIAYYELLGILTDNYKIKSDNNKYEYYKGAWQMFLRDIDPSSTTRKRFEEDNEDEVLTDTFWWSKPVYKNWDISNIDWVEEIKDLPKAKEIILKKDDNNYNWICLKQHYSWDEPKRLGEDKFSSHRKSINFLTNAYLVRKTEKKKIINYLKDKNFDGRWMPEDNDGYSKLFNREKFWSPAYFHEEKEKTWETIDGTNYKVIIPITSAKGGIDDDKSGANFKYSIPCKTIFEGMNLEYSPIDGDFKNQFNEVVVTNVDYEHALIRKDLLLTFLKEKNLDIIWTILGEKIAKTSNSDQLGRDYTFGHYSGVFWLEDEYFKGDLIKYDERE